MRIETPRLIVRELDRGDLDRLAAIYADRQEPEVAYPLDAPWWGKGLATEAATAVRDFALVDLGREQIVSCVFPDSAASIHVAQKIGMTYEKDFDWSGHTLSLYAQRAAPH